MCECVSKNVLLLLKHGIFGQKYYKSVMSKSILNKQLRYSDGVRFNVCYN